MGFDADEEADWLSRHGIIKLPISKSDMDSAHSHGSERYRSAATYGKVTTFKSEAVDDLQANVIGLIGEIVFGRYIDQEPDFNIYKKSDEQDFMINGNKVDAKTTSFSYGTITTVYDTLNCLLKLRQIKKEVDFYVSLMVDASSWKWLYVMGYIEKNRAISYPRKQLGAMDGLAIIIPFPDLDTPITDFVSPISIEDSKEYTLGDFM